MKTMMIRRYTTAHTAPIVSGLRITAVSCVQTGPGDYCAYRHLYLPSLGHVHALESNSHESVAEPSDEGVGGAEGNAAEGN